MGYYITKIKETKLNEYIGSQTIYSCADKGAFNGKVSKELEDYADSGDNIVAIVDEKGISNFLNVLRSGKCHGRDVEKFAKIVEKNYTDGFILRG